MSTPMKGLVQFIADLRNSKAQEAEVLRINTELANIRAKFRDSNLTGYNKKKYVCKLLYIYILGYTVDLGSTEVLSLLHSSKYSEKQVGYLGVSLMLNSNDRVLAACVSEIRIDLQSLNEIHTCLALSCLATVGTRPLAEALSDDVFKLLISPTSPSTVRKKAALAFLRLYRRSSGAVMQDSWYDRVIALLDSPDIGVATSVAALVVALAKDNPARCAGAQTRAVRRLQALVFNGAFSDDYVYYQVPAPWLMIKLLKLLQYFGPTSDETIGDMLDQVIRRVIEVHSQAPADPATAGQQANAQHAVLFEAISLAIHLDADQALLHKIVDSLGSFLASPETNVRYLSLDTMAQLAARYHSVPIHPYLDTVFAALRDRDVSVRRKAVNLLYCACDSATVRKIVHRLLAYLPSADFAIREEMVVRVAVLIEKYATEFRWYVDISLQLIAVAGSHVSDEVWQRVVQIVVNNESLQAYAARTVYNYLKQPTCCDNMVKVAGYILGEYGHLIADPPDNVAPLDQFLALHDRFPACSQPTKILLLTAYLKFVALFAEIRPQLLQVFEHHSRAMDTEIQQRACEYLRLAAHPNKDLLQAVSQEIPPFPQRSSALLSRLDTKENISEDRRTWLTGEAKNEAKNEASNDVSEPNTPHPGLDRNSSTLNSLRGLKIAPTLASGWEAGYKHLLTHANGTLYRDSLLQIDVKSEYRKNLGCVIVHLVNKGNTPLTSLAVDLVNNASDQYLLMSTKNLPESQVAPGHSTQLVIILDARQPFARPPFMKVSYMAGSLHTLTLKLPVVLEKFMEPVSLAVGDFFGRWQQLGTDGGREAQRSFRNISASASAASQMGPEPDNHSHVRTLNWFAVEGADRNPHNAVGSAIVHTSAGGNFGCLLRLEPDELKHNYRVTVRATDPRVAPVLVHNLVESFTL